MNQFNSIQTARKIGALLPIAIRNNLSNSFETCSYYYKRETRMYPTRPTVHVDEPLIEKCENPLKIHIVPIKLCEHVWKLTVG